MPSVTVGQLPRTNVVGAHDRLFYSAMAVSMALTVLIGFGPTYYLKIRDPAAMATFNGGPMTPLVHAHGILFTGWMLLFVAQTSLVAQRRIAIHRRMGVAGAVLAAAMLLTGTLAALRAASRGSGPGGADPMSFLMIPLSDMFFFGLFVATALSLRANSEAHKRLMLLAYVSIVVAAVARLPGVLPLGPLAFFGFSFLFILIGVAYDLVTRKRVHPVYVWGGGILFLSVPLRLAVSQTDAWKAFARALVSLV